ncbi:MAG TPA: MBL fold metallo-hydrolase [Ramlibacter sp.]|nr:MBL fold metallo-hydrolase [Ramlibacter sp.]
MISDHAIRTAKGAIAAAATVMLAACGGGGTPITAETKPFAGPLAADLPLAKAYDSAAKAFSDSTDNPVLKWHYRVWCQTGYRSPGDAGTGQVVDRPADPQVDQVSPTGFNHSRELGQGVHVGGSKILDNAWYFGTDYTGMVIVKLPDGGLVMLDALTTPNDMQTQVLDQMPAAGLNPADVKYIFIGHEHGDHYGGVDLVKQKHAPNAKVVASRPAADAIAAARTRAATRTYTGTAAEQEAAKARALLAIPEKIDIIVEPYGSGVLMGQRRIPVTTGIEAVAMLAPGHTPGQLHVIIPVMHQGSARKLFVWSGNDQPDQADQYAASTDFVAGIAFKESAEAFINTHSYQGAMFANLRAMKANPNTPNHLWMGKQGVQRYMGIFSNCQRAVAERLRDGTWKVF